MVYKMLALNIDHTVIHDNGKIDKSTKEAIEYAIEKDIFVTLVTGRNYPYANRIASLLKLNSYIISHQGAYIANGKDHPLLLKRIGESVTIELVTFLEAMDCSIRLIHDERTVSNKKKMPANLMGKMILQPANRFSYAEQYVDSLVEHLETHALAPPKIEVTFDHPTHLKDAKQAIEAMFDEVDCVTIQDTLAIVPKGVSKLKGLTYVCDRLKINREEVVMIGSGYDDAPLIDWAGLGVAMGNAPETVKRQADWITRSNNQNGVAYMVKEHFRKQHPIRFLKKMNILK